MKPKKWKIKELEKHMNALSKTYWNQIKFKDKLMLILFTGAITKFGIFCFLYAYELGRRKK